MSLIGDAQTTSACPPHRQMIVTNPSPTPEKPNKGGALFAVDIAHGSKTKARPPSVEFSFDARKARLADK